MSILTPMHGGKYKASIQHFEHPADAYRTFDCGCGGTVRITETPDFEPGMDWYDVMAACDACKAVYLVIGIASDAQMAGARLMAMNFFMGVEDGGQVL